MEIICKLKSFLSGRILFKTKLKQNIVAWDLANYFFLKIVLI